MNLNKDFWPTNFFQHHCKNLPVTLPAILPLIFFQGDQTDLILWILIGVGVGIFLIFILIAFILQPLSRRSQQRSQQKEEQKKQADIETQPSLPAIGDDDDVTELTFPSPAVAETSPPATIEDEVDTVVSPVIHPVADPIVVPVSGARPANINWQIAALTDVGLKRELNEDSMLMIEGEMDGGRPYGLYVVADGLGGHEAGEVASQLTVETIQQHHEQHPPTTADAPYEEWFKRMIDAANDVVLQHQQDDPEKSRMGSTLVMALIVDNNAHIVNVGDSRAYRLNSSLIEQISVDHSLVERLVQIGQITREEARNHKQKNVIYSIIGEKQKLEIGYYHVAFAPNERLLLCSDGLSGMVTDEKLLALSQHEADPGKVNQLMVKAAKQAGGQDNITAIIVQMNGGEG